MEKEIAQKEIDGLLSEILSCKDYLNKTDYIIMKEYEGEDVSKYSGIKEERVRCRVRINEAQATVISLSEYLNEAQG